MAHEIETIAYAHATPWHGLGNRVEETVSIEEMLVAAGLDWTVDLKDCYTEIDGKKIKIDRRALVRSKDQKILTISGPGWKPLQNAQAMEFFRDYCAAGGMTLETAGSLRGGKIVWALAKVNAGFMLNGRDEVGGYVLLVSPHEVGKAITVRITSIRVVCANTLAMAGGVEGKGSQYRQSHVKEFDMTAAKATVEMVRAAIAQMELDAQALQQMQMSSFDTVRFLAKFFQPATEDLISEDERAKILLEDETKRNNALGAVLWANEKAPGATPGNGWGTLNAVTYFADHMAGSQRDARLFNSWLGNMNRVKGAVAAELVQMAA